MELACGVISKICYYVVYPDFHPMKLLKAKAVRLHSVSETLHLKKKDTLLLHTGLVSMHLTPSSMYYAGTGKASRAQDVNNIVPFHVA